MKMTIALKAWLVEHKGVEKDASDDDYRKAAGEALADGSLTVTMLAELTVDKEDSKAVDLASKLDAVVNGLAKLAEAQTKALEKKVEPEPGNTAPKKKVEPENKAAPLPEDFQKNVGLTGGDTDMGSSEPRVKNAAEMYSSTKSIMTYPDTHKSGQRHAQAGMPVMSMDGRVMEHPSDRDKAVNGVYLKLLCATAQRNSSREAGYAALKENEKELLQYAMREYNWAGATDGGDYEDIKDRRLSPREQKDLIDDAASGGLEAAPIVFDDDVISAPLLQGELYPLVKVVPLERGRRIEAVSIGNITMTWGGVDATPIAVFNTAAYVAAFDTTIYRIEGYVRIGKDFISDTPINFGQIFTQQYGERLLQELDDVIATGNGTTQPEGITIHAGVTAVAWGGVTSLGNYEAMRYTVPKQEHTAAVKNSIVFCGTEQSFERAKAIPVGAADARRIFGMDYDEYSIMNRPYKINESLANTQVFYAVLARYRMYRRRGLTIEMATGGETLTRRHEIGINATARFGGQLERAACAALTTTAPA